MNSSEFSKEEAERIDNIAKDSWYARGVNAASVRHSVEIFARFWQGHSVLELGPAEGIATAYLVERFPEVTCVDGSPTFASALQEKYPNATVVTSLFENYQPAKLFENIVLGHVLEHVENPVELLSRVREWITPTGRIFAAVPNCHSIHRQMAVEMGILPSEDALNSTDIHHGHRRVYSRQQLLEHFRLAGLKILVSGGYWLKPISNGQIDAQWTQEMISAAMKVGELYPDISAEIYVVASKK